MGDPSLSVVVPAHDEADELPATLAGLHAGLTSAGVEYEIIVVDNASMDSTARVAVEAGARVVHEPYRQISRARDTGAAQARGEWLLFVDADTWPSADLLAAALGHLEAGACGGGARVAMDALPNRMYRWGVAAWNRLARWMRLAAGCFVFVRRDAFEAVGGFDTRYFAGDEVILSRRLSRWGRAQGRPFVIIDDPPVATSARKAEWFSPGWHLLTLLMVVLCPPVMRSRRLMWFWYWRPAAKRGSRAGEKHVR
jgi:glycosyltransferase involved in cell wall biosynthesis